MTLTLPEKIAALARQGQWGDAERLCAGIIADEPGNAAAHGLYAELLARRGDSDAALIHYGHAIALQPADASILYNRANLFQALGRPADALADYDAALALAPGFGPAWNNRASSLAALGRLAEALESYDRILALHPDIAEIWHNRGNLLRRMGRLADALESHDRTLTHKPGYAQAWADRGSVLWALDRTGEALASLERALALDPSAAATWDNRGNLLRTLRRPADALASYDRALALDPGRAASWTHRAVASRDLGRLDQALADYARALQLAPGDADALDGRAALLWTHRGDGEGALRDLEALVEAHPEHRYALGNLLHMRLYRGDWHGFDDMVARIDAGVRAGRRVVQPFQYQAISNAPGDLQACSRIHAAHRYPAMPPILRRAPNRSEKIRLGYVSGEFREHATALLMAGIYEHHDRDRFTLVAIETGARDESATRHRLERAFDRFVPITHLSDRAAAEAIVAEDIDILINLNGYFGAERMGVFGYRPAPIQVNYLGFPGTLGAPTIDYLIADSIVIPEEDRRFYDEAIVYLPHSYQATDRGRLVPGERPSRGEAGLPEKGVVFCNFNSSYKFTPACFDVWMRILRGSEGSVLWLLGGAPLAASLCREAAARGVDGARLVFAPVVPAAQHLARLPLADLVLDSLPYNAHTTASDALWAGVPLLTCIGRTFPGRVATSLLHAVGLPELVTENWEDYERRALALARDPHALASLRAKLADNRLSTPLFDTARQCLDLEAAYSIMAERSRRGETPTGFAVP